jgi:hypothetical protein
VARTVGAEFEADHAVDLVGARGQEQDRQRGIARAQALEDFEAAEVGQADVEDDERGTVGGGQRRFATGAPARLEPFGAQSVLQRVGNARFIFDDQDDGPAAHGGVRAR